MKLFRKATAAVTTLVFAAGYVGSLPYTVLSAEAYSKADIVAAVNLHNRNNLLNRI